MNNHTIIGQRAYLVSFDELLAGILPVYYDALVSHLTHSKVEDTRMRVCRLSDIALTTLSRHTFFVSGHEQHIFFPDFPSFCLGWEEKSS